MALAPVVGNVSAQLGRADAVSIPAARALGFGGGAGELPALSTTLAGSGSLELKKAVAEARKAGFTVIVFWRADRPDGLDAAGIEASVRKRFGAALSLVKPAVND